MVIVSAETVGTAAINRTKDAARAQTNPYLFMKAFLPGRSSINGRAAKLPPERDA
jgi:hypothetical protein